MAKSQSKWMCARTHDGGVVVSRRTDEGFIELLRAGSAAELHRLLQEAASVVDASRHFDRREDA